MAEEELTNYDSLERELMNKIEADKKYWRENDAKFRAIEQKVANYNEFQEIVKAAHLKPLDKKERVENITSKNSIWNSFASKNGMCRETLSAFKQTVDGNSLPGTHGEFIRMWKNINNDDRFSLLKAYKRNNLRTLFELEIPADIFGEIFQVLLLYDSTSDFHTVIEILEELSLTKRFHLSLQLLNSSEKEACIHLLEKLERNYLNILDKCKDEDVSPQGYLHLKNKYQITNAPLSSKSSKLDVEELLKGFNVN